MNYMSKKSSVGNIVIPILGVVAVLLISIVSYFLFFRNKKTLHIDVAKDQLPAQTADVIIGNGSKKIIFATHWSSFQIDGIYEGSELKSKGLRQYAEEYVKLHPEVQIEIKSILPTEYHEKLQILHQADQAPDIFQIFSQWGAPYVQAGMLDQPPIDVVNDVKRNYISRSGVTVNNQIWGIPAEIDDYVLVYNKKFFAEAGITTPPKTWDELIVDAIKTTKTDNGKITRYGIAFLKDDYELVVDPFMGLVFSNNGSFVSPDMKKSAINSPEAVEVLDKETELFRKGATDINGNFYDFGTSKVAMVVSPPWLKKRFMTSFGDQFDSTVGLAPLPYFKKPATLQYSWFAGVMSKSKNKQVAWDFLRWMSQDIQPITGTTRYGDLLANTIGAIPSRKTDLEKESILQNRFTQMFIKELPHAMAVPNIKNFAQMRVNLMNEIQNAWVGTKTPQQALNDAAAQMNATLGGANK